MPLVRRIQRRGATFVVEAHGEVLFAATGPVGRWTNRFSQRARAFTAQEAPANKRPRWAHYGKPLKSTFTASTTYQPGRMRVYAAVGSTAPYAGFVDQGTGVYNGGGAYPAKVLPPWHWGSPSLYESTWRPPAGGRAGANAAVWTRPKVAPVMIKGQKGQFFFDKGLARAFRSMRMRAFQVPGEGGPKISGVLASAPSAITGVVSNASSGSAFRSSLEEWRSWRDEHYNKGRVMGGWASGTAEGRRRDAARAASTARRQMNKASSAARRKQAAAERARKWREDNKKAKSTAKPKQQRQDKVDAKARSVDRTAFLMAMQKKYGNSNVDRSSLKYTGGYWYVLVRVVDETASGDMRPRWKEVRGKAKT